MDRRNSPINDLYGTAPQDEPPRRRSRVGLYLLLGAIGFFIFASIRPVMRLRTDLPPSVVGDRLNHGVPGNQLQMQVTQACWAYAVNSVQKLYPYGANLPKEPPASARSSILKPTALRELCWPRLRNAWTRPDSWKRSYEWSTDWLTDPDSSFQQTLNKVMNELGINFQ